MSTSSSICECVKHITGTSNALKKVFPAVDDGFGQADSSRSVIPPELVQEASSDGLGRVSCGILLSQRFPDECRKPSRSSYSDSEVHEIQSLLLCVHPEWSHIPRTYIILRHIRKTDQIRHFLVDGYTDYWLPLQTTWQFPRSVPPEVQTEFKEAQFLIAAKISDVENVENRQHRAVESSDSTVLESIEILGEGRSGVVDRVRSRLTSKEYARKRILKSGLIDRQGGRLPYVWNEIEIMKKMNHHHTATYAGSYTDPEYFIILSTPIADQDLAKYLKNLDSQPQEPTHSILRAFFGCLATAVAYLHEKKIRHKDIKPGNILVKGDRVFLTDFGLSTDFTLSDGCTTSGPTCNTPRYCAPEVADGEDRDYSADIWSLGCVYLEMLAVLNGCPNKKLYDFLENCPTGRKYPWQNTNDISTTIRKVMAMSSSDTAIAVLVENMLREDRRSRPTVSEVLSSLRNASRGQGFSYYGSCCVEKDATAFVCNASAAAANDDLLEENLTSDIKLSRSDSVLEDVAVFSIPTRPGTGSTPITVSPRALPISEPATSTIKGEEQILETTSGNQLLEQLVPRSSTSEYSRSVLSNSGPVPASLRRQIPYELSKYGLELESNVLHPRTIIKKNEILQEKSRASTAGSPWKAAEDDALKRLVRVGGREPHWDLIAAKIPNRTALACSYRYEKLKRMKPSS